MKRITRKPVTIGVGRKKKLTADGIQIVSITHEFKFMAPDGRQRAADALIALH